MDVTRRTERSATTVTGSIGSRIKSGLAWKAASQTTLQLSRLVVALILARVLAPHDWGIAAMVLVFSGVVVVFTDSALGTALIQRRDLREEDRSTVFWLTAAIGVILLVAGLALARPLADFYGEPEVAPLFAVLSVSFFVTALGTTQQALLARDMRFRRLELRQIGATTVGATTGIVVAFAGYGPWAIVALQLAEAATSTVLLWYLAEWRPSMTFSLASIRRLGAFAGNVFAENLLYQGGRNLGPLLIGRSLGPAALGTYALAANVILVPFSRIAGPLQQVFFPAFAQMSDDRERTATVWIRATRLVGALSIPALVGLVVVAPDFVSTVLGDRWAGVTTVIQILAVAGLVQSLQTLSGEVLLAVGRADWLLRFTVLWFAASLLSFVLGLRWGIVGVAACYAVATVAVEPVRTWITARALGISPWEFVRAFGGVAQATAVMAAALLVVRPALVAAGAPSVARLLTLIVLGCVTYAAGCWWRAPDLVGELRGAIGGRRFRARARIETIEARP